jgi:hypothetical protein
VAGFNRLGYATVTVGDIAQESNDVRADADREQFLLGRASSTQTTPDRRSCR